MCRQRSNANANAAYIALHTSSCTHRVAHIELHTSLAPVPRTRKEIEAQDRSNSARNESTAVVYKAAYKSLELDNNCEAHDQPSLPAKSEPQRTKSASKERFQSASKRSSQLELLRFTLCHQLAQYEAIQRERQLMMIDICINRPLYHTTLHAE